MNSPHFEIQSTLSRWCALHREVLRPAGISVNELTCLTYIYTNKTETAWNLLSYGTYNQYGAVLRGLSQLRKKGYIDKTGINYYCTGKGEMLILKFADFLNTSK